MIAVLGETGIYVPALDEVFNTLNEIHSGDGYYLRTTEAATTYLLTQGLVTPPDTPLALHAGWNWIGYLPTSTLPVQDALASIDGLYQRVISLDKAYIASIPPSFNTLKDLEPGKGYLIYMDADGTMSYPSDPACGAASRSKPHRASPPAAPTSSPRPAQP